MNRRQLIIGVSMIGVLAIVIAVAPRTGVEEQRAVDLSPAHSRLLAQFNARHDYHLFIGMGDSGVPEWKAVTSTTAHP